MSEPRRHRRRAARRAGSLLGRVARAWRELPPERRLAAGAAIGLFLTLFLPWYQETVVAAGKSASALVDRLGRVLVRRGGRPARGRRRARAALPRAPRGAHSICPAATAASSPRPACGPACSSSGGSSTRRASASAGPARPPSGVEWGIFVALAVAAPADLRRARASAAPTRPSRRCPTTMSTGCRQAERARGLGATRGARRHRARGA